MNIFASLIRRSERRRAYENLRQFDDHLLRDIGLEAQVARRESVKPFWQP